MASNQRSLSGESLSTTATRSSSSRNIGRPSRNAHISGDLNGGGGSLRKSLDDKLAATTPPPLNADILFKMSKKIAQLTKVVFILNSKQEDHANELRDAQTAHEHEIAMVCP